MVFGLLTQKTLVFTANCEGFPPIFPSSISWKRVVVKQKWLDACALQREHQENVQCSFSSWQKRRCWCPHDLDLLIDPQKSNLPCLDSPSRGCPIGKIHENPLRSSENLRWLHFPLQAWYILYDSSSPGWKFGDFKHPVIKLLLWQRFQKNTAGRGSRWWYLCLFNILLENMDVVCSCLSSG